MSGWTEQDLAARNRELGILPCGHPVAKYGACGIPWCEHRSAPVLSLDVPLLPIAKPRRGRMNKLEARFLSEVIGPRKDRAEIEWYGFEPIKFRLADGAWYTPDFVIQENILDGLARPRCFFTAIEVKGFWREAARVRIKVAADKYPFRFVAVTLEKKTGEWKYETFTGRATA